MYFMEVVNPKGNQPWIFLGRTDAEAEAPILWPPDAKSRLIGKDPDAGKYWSQEEKGVTEDEMVRWHQWLNGHEFEQTLGDGEGQGTLACYSPCGLKELDTVEPLNNNNEMSDLWRIGHKEKHPVLQPRGFEQHWAQLGEAQREEAGPQLVPWGTVQRGFLGSFEEPRTEPSWRGTRLLMLKEEEWPEQDRKAATTVDRHCYKKEKQDGLPWAVREILNFLSLVPFSTQKKISTRNKDLLYSTGNYILYLVIAYNGE